MKIKLISKLSCAIPLSLLFLLASCEKFLEVDRSPDLVPTDYVFTTDKTAIAAITGLYLQMRSQNNILSNGGLSVYASLLADDIYNTTSNSVNDPFYQDALLSTNSTVNGSFWSVAYRNIYHANAILEGISRSNSLTDTLKTQIIGEAKTIRAFYYFYLVNLFGDVPLVLTTDPNVSEKMPRMDVSIVNAQIEQDLLDAEASLKNNYPGPNKSRVNKYSATALLARLYLYTKDWTKAELKSGEVVNSGMYHLVSVANNFDGANNAETIWQLISDYVNTSEAASFLSTGKPAFFLTTSLFNSFDSGDFRKKNWLLKYSTSGDYYPNKYKQRTVPSAGMPSEYLIVFRLAEQYLIRAEARAQLNKIAEAKEDLNEVRQRAGLNLTMAQTQDVVLRAIEKERRWEFFTEWGHRWLDLKRTSRIDEVLGATKTGWEPYKSLFPIPESEILRNPFLTQNPGY
jgi:hypothetical protein